MLRTVVGKELAMATCRKDTLPFPDGANLVKPASRRIRWSEFPPAFVPGSATTAQVMVKDTCRYAETGGWGFNRLVDGKPTDAAEHRTCFAWHAAHVVAHDIVFTRLAP